MTCIAINERLLTALDDACIVSSIHRLHLLPRFDTVILMEHGRIIDRGKPDELRSRQLRFFAHWTQLGAEMPESRVPQRRPVAQGTA